MEPPSKWRFQPRGDLRSLENKFKQVPPFLFLTYSPGFFSIRSSHNFVRSAAIWNGYDDGDLLGRDKELARCMLEKHLLRRPSVDDNLISWTDSIVVAIDHAISILHADEKHVAANIRLCILNTQRIDCGSLLSAPALMDALRVPNEGYLKHQIYDGEYLSQGELDIRGKSSTTSLQELIESGLFKTFPPFILHDTSPKTIPSHVRVRELYRAFRKNDWVYEYPVQHIHWAKNMACSSFSDEWAQEAVQQAFLSLMPHYNQENSKDSPKSHFWKLGRCQVHEPSSPFAEKDERVQSSHVSPLGDWIVATYKTFLLLIKAYPAPLNGHAKTVRLSLHPSHIDMIKDFNNGVAPELSHARFTIVEDDLFVVVRSGRCLVMWGVKSVVEDGTDFCFITHCLDEETAHREFEALCS